MISTGGVISQLIIPSIVSVVVSALCVSLYLKGEVVAPKQSEANEVRNSPADRKIILIFGVGGLIFVPIFRMLTGLPLSWAYSSLSECCGL